MKITHVMIHLPAESRYGRRLIIVEKKLCETKGFTWLKGHDWQPTCKKCLWKTA